MAKSVDATDLKSVGEIHAGSNPAERTTKKRKKSPSNTLHKRNLEMYFLRQYLGVSYAEIARIYQITKPRTRQIIDRETEYIDHEERSRI